MRKPALRRRRHPAPAQLSRYLDGDLAPGDRQGLETHVFDCAACRRMLRSLAYTVRALGSMREQASHELAESIITALRTTGVPEAAPRAGAIGAGAGVLLFHRPLLTRGLASLRDCLRRSRLRLTLPIAVLVGAILSLVNQGGMLLAGEIDLRTCAICGLNFVLPFVALNVLLVAAANLARDQS